MKARSCAEYNDFGKHYYYKDAYFGAMSDELREFCRGLTGMDRPEFAKHKWSVLLNAYPSDGSGSIGWHTDKTTNLEPDSRVYSYSTYLGTDEDVPQTLIDYKDDSETHIISIRYGQCLSWPAHSHHRLGIKHRVRKSPHRLNITLRALV
jgi:hypothetical protein